MKSPKQAAPPAAAPWKRIIGALALGTGLLGACSTVTLGYNRAATLSYWWVDGQVDLMPEQGRVLRDALDSLHRWHREHELPRYAQRLQRWQALARRELTADQVCAEYGHVREALLALGERAVAPLGALAASLSDAQIEHLQREHAKNNDEYRDDFLTPDQGLEERLKRSVRRAEMVYGRLDAAQRRLLREQLARGSFDARRLLAERERRQGDIVAAVRQARQGNPVAAARGVMERLIESPTPGWTAYAQALTREGCEQFAALHNSTTAAQRAHAVEAFKGYERDFLALARAD